MRRIVVILAALLLTLATAVPAAANEKVHAWDYTWTYEDVVTEDWGFQCTGTIYHGATFDEDLWLWYRNGLSEAEMFPEDAPWPWIKGLYTSEGVDWFRGENGERVAGPWKAISHLYDHVAVVPETWREVVSGTWWGVRAPHYGTIFQEAIGAIHQNVVITPDGNLYTVIKEAAAAGTFDVEELCEALGYELAP